jgi:hypothetical protein
VHRAQPHAQVLLAVEVAVAADTGDSPEDHARLVDVGFDRGGVVCVGESGGQPRVASAEDVVQFGLGARRIVLRPGDQASALR